MKATVRLAGFAAVAATAFGAAGIAGGAVDADHPNSEGTARPAHGDEMTKMPATHGAEHAPAGLAIADQGLRLDLAVSSFDAGRREPLRFRVVDAAGRTVRDF